MAPEVTDITKIAIVLERELCVRNVNGMHSKAKICLLREQFFHLRCQRTDLCEVILLPPMIGD